MAKEILALVVLGWFIGCVNSSDNSPGDLVGKWVGASASRNGTMCQGTYNNPCSKTVRWVRKDESRYEFSADSTGINRFHHVRVNGTDSSDSWERTDSLRFSIQADTMIFHVFKTKYERDSVFIEWDDVKKYPYQFINGDLILKNYSLRDTTDEWFVDFKLSKVE